MSHPARPPSLAIIAQQPLLEVAKSPEPDITGKAAVYQKHHWLMQQQVVAAVAQELKGTFQEVAVAML